MNADSVRLVKELYNDNELRAATVLSAEKFVENDQAVSYALGKDSTTNVKALVDSLQKEIAYTHQLPLGWNSQKVPWFEEGKESKEIWLWWLNKILGLIISIGAVSLGSTYWYRQLKSLLNLRFNLGGGGSKKST